MRNNILVSVCVVTYNHKEYIKQCLDSILMQKTDFSFEIVLGEDESNDGTREICQDYAKRYPDIIKLFLRSRKDVIYINGNPTGRFNFIENLKSVKGKYIAICEGDDYWTDPYKLQKQVDFLEKHNDYFFVSANSELHKNNQHIITSIKEELVIEDFIEGNTLGRQAAALMFKNNNLNEFLEYIKNYSWPFGDLLLIFWCLKKGKGKVLKDVMVYYRVHQGGAWSSTNHLKRFKNFILFYSLVFKSEINPNYTFELYNKSIDWVLKQTQDSIGFTKNKQNKPEIKLSYFKNILKKIKK